MYTSTKQTRICEIERRLFKKYERNNPLNSRTHILRFRFVNLFNCAHTHAQPLMDFELTNIVNTAQKGLKQQSSSCTSMIMGIIWQTGRIMILTLYFGPTPAQAKLIKCPYPLAAAKVDTRTQRGTIEYRNFKSICIFLKKKTPIQAHLDLDTTCKHIPKPAYIHTSIWIHSVPTNRNQFEYTHIIKKTQKTIQCL